LVLAKLLNVTNSLIKKVVLTSYLFLLMGSYSKCQDKIN
jgi:hypothetical protein